MSRAKILMGLCLSLTTAAAWAQIGNFVISDGECRYELGGLIGQRLGGNGGVGNLFGGGLDHLFQNWFWYRGGGDTREYALSNQIFGAAAGNQARIIYLEPINDGNTPNVLLFDLEYTIHDVTGEIPSVHHKCELVIAIKVRNVTPLTQPVDFFSYNDLDLNNTAANDSAVISGIDNQIQIVRDPDGGGLCRVGAVYKVSSTNHVSWEIGPFPATLNKLTNAVPDVLANAASPFGPGDYTGAQEWRFALSPANQLFDEWVGSVVKEVALYLPGDVDGSGAVDLGDLAILLANFGMICP